MNSAQRSALDPQLREALSSLGSKLASNESVESELKSVLQGLNLLPAHAAVRAEREINITAMLYRNWGGKPRHSLFGMLSWPTEMDDLKRYPGIEYLFIFHENGYVREAALKQIQSGLPSPFLFAAIAWRLNDWALPVRLAAVECAKRAFPRTAAEIVAHAAMALLSRESSWRRWTTERNVLIETFSRPDVAAALTEIIQQKQTGGISFVLQCALQNPRIDPFLERLATKAMQPTVRAIALQSLINGYASLPGGFSWQWIDKSMGIRRRVRTFSQRPLTVNVLRRTAITMGLADRSAAVKKVALDALTRYRAEILGANELIAPLLDHRIASVRERARFLQSLLADESSFKSSS